MRIEKETEVTIKVKIGYVWPDDFLDEFDDTSMTDEEFRNWNQSDWDYEQIVMTTWEQTRDLLQGAEVTIRQLGVVQE